MPFSPHFAIASGIIATLRAAGYEAYLAGGCVRDLLLGRTPKDYDVTTSATPDVVLDMFPRTYGVGAQFGVVLVATAIESTTNSAAGEEPGADAEPDAAARKPRDRIDRSRHLPL